MAQEENSSQPLAWPLEGFRAQAPCQDHMSAGRRGSGFRMEMLFHSRMLRFIQNF